MASLTSLLEAALRKVFRSGAALRRRQLDNEDSGVMKRKYFFAVIFLNKGEFLLILKYI